MKFALFSGCRTGFDLPQYKASARVVLPRLGIGIEEPDFNCCGYPAREKDPRAFMLLAVRNLALAQSLDLPVLTLCKCCFGALKQAAFHYAHNPDLRHMTAAPLKREGLRYDGSVPVVHVLQLFDQNREFIRDRIVRRLTGLKVAAHYGCHALRPSQVTQFDQPYSPAIFERVLALTGVQPVTWERRLQCCGSPVSKKNPALSERLARQKMENARSNGADLICSACSYCQIQFDRYQREDASCEDPENISSILLTQLMGIALGIQGKELGISSPVARVLRQGASPVCA